MPDRRAVAVMLKSPDSGAVKTRLTPPISSEDAAGLYRCFIKDTFAGISSIGDSIDTFAAFVPAGAERAIKKIVPDNARLILQEGKDLGERLSGVFERLFDLGYSKIVIIGSDSPDIPVAYIEDAFAQLAVAGSRLVLGPASDGGYYLIGMNSFMPAPFIGIPWSKASVLEATIKAAKSSSIAITLLRRWHDIDEVDDLAILIDNPKTPASACYLRDNGIVRLLKQV